MFIYVGRSSIVGYRTHNVKQLKNEDLRTRKSAVKKLTGSQLSLQHGTRN